MLIEKRIQKLLNKIYENTQVRVDILDINGTIVASSEEAKIGDIELFFKSGENIEAKNSFIYNGKTYMKVVIDNTLSYYLSVEGKDKTSLNYCKLIASMIEFYLKLDNYKIDREGYIRRVLLGQATDLEFQEFIRNYKIEVEVPRCVFVIQTEMMQADEIYNILSKAFPKEQEDFLVLMDSRTVALIKNVPDEMDEEELVQLAAAINETVLNETFLKINVGIGRCKDTVYEIQESYLEAIESIEIGAIYDPESKVYMYDALLLERFLSEVPDEISRKYYKNIFNDELKKILNEEMIATIEKFFENNLNLSETARQLYIHRNTLVYRLDKIQKVLGLDLRNFRDALTFKIMMMLERQNREC